MQKKLQMFYLAIYFNKKIIKMHYLNFLKVVNVKIQAQEEQETSLLVFLGSLSLKIYSAI